MNHVNVISFPDRRRGNPYQSLLAQAVAEKGVVVNFCRGRGHFPLHADIGRNSKAQVIHLHWTNPFTVSQGTPRTLYRAAKFLGTLAWLKLSGRKVVWTVHNLVNHEQLHSRIELLCNRLIAKLCDQLIVHFPEAVDIVQKEYRLSSSKRISVIPHGHLIDCYPNLVTREQARDQLGLDPSALVFLFFGLVRSYKDLPSLISAFRKLNITSLHLLIAGAPKTPEIRDWIMSQCMEDGRIWARLEFIPDHEIQCFMQAADAVVLPSSNMLTSGSAVLAMSFGKAIIAADTAHLRYLLGDDGGILYNSRRDNCLHLALREATSADLASMGRRNYEFIRSFTWEKVAEETVAVYRQVLGQSASEPILRCREN